MATSESEAHIESNLRTSIKATFTYQYIHPKSCSITRKLSKLSTEETQIKGRFLNMQGS